MNKNKLGIFVSLPLFALFSCAPNAQQIKVKISNNNIANSTIYTPENVEVTETLHSFEEKQYYNLQVMPSIGDVNLLVVPVLIPEFNNIDLNNDGVNDNDKVRQDIYTAFFGEDETQLGFESVKTFYQKSSFNKLNISGTVTEWFDVEKELGYTKAGQITSSVTQEIAQKAIDNLRNTSTLTGYDSDQDGFIDGVWLVYSSPNYTNGGLILDDNNYWAYTGWMNQDNRDGDINAPIINLYGWASYDFMYGKYENKLDSHTYIHETGHFLGLNDYYSTDANGSSYSPLGKVDMMDANIIDHNSYTKMILGWTKPYLVYGNAEIDLKSVANENSLIVLLPDDKEVSNKFNPFDEYILIEYYTNEGLNNLDSTTLYDFVKAPTEDGVKIYHIDKRVYLMDSVSQTIVPYTNQELNENNGLATPITNSRDQDNYNIYFNFDILNNLYDEIRLIESDGRDTLSYGGIFKDETLFKPGDNFSIKTHSAWFLDEKLNNGKEFSYVVEVN